MLQFSLLDLCAIPGGKTAAVHASVCSHFNQDRSLCGK